MRSNSVFVCMCVCLYTHVHSLVWAHVGGQRLMLRHFPQSLLRLTFWDRVYHWTVSLPFRLDCHPARPWDLPLWFLALGLPTPGFHTQLLHGCWQSKLRSFWGFQGLFVLRNSLEKHARMKAWFSLDLPIRIILRFIWCLLWRRPCRMPDTNAHRYTWNQDTSSTWMYMKSYVVPFPLYPSQDETGGRNTLGGVDLDFL